MRIRERAPETRSMFGETIVVPEFVGVSCDRCGASGYLHENSAMITDRLDEELLCGNCEDK